MAKTRFYEARIFHKDGEEIINVDVASLPRGRFNKNQPLLITSDVVMDNGKKKALPDFSDVIITGGFDCSSYTITADSVLPNGITELTCLHSINSLDTLMENLPSSVRKVLVRTAVLNAVKKDTDGALTAAKDFTTKYPNVVVTDGKSVLFDILQEIARGKESVSTENVTTTPAKTEVASKTDDWLCTDELIVAYKQHESAVSDMSDEEIARAIRIVRKNFKKRELMRQDGAIVSCIHCDDMANLVDAINQQQKRNIMQQKQSVAETTPKKTEIKPQTPVERQPAAQKFFVGNKEVQETVIKKYIKNSVWKSVCNHCKSDLDKKLAFLQAIEDINVRPVDTAGKQVCYVQDGMLKTSPTITFKNVQWLSQGFGTLDDRARIIWCMNEYGFIATEYFAEHEKKQSVDYKKAIRQKDISGITTDDTLSVSDLITQLTAERNNRLVNVADSSNSEPVQDTVSVPEIVHEPEQPATETVVNEPKKRVRQRIVKSKVTGVKPSSDKKQKQVRVLESTKQTGHKPIIISTELVTVSAGDSMQHKDYESVKWTDYESLHASFVVKLQDLNTTQAELLQKLLTEQNTDSALEYSQQLNSLLLAKKKCEQALVRLQVLNQELQQIKHDFENQI